MKSQTRRAVVGTVAVAALAVSCGSPETVTLSDGAAPASTIARDLGSDMLNRDVPLDRDGDGGGSTSTTQAPSTSAAVEPLGPDGAFTADGKPARVLVRPAGSDDWFWIDAQTGDYIAPGTEPEQRPIDPANEISARATLPFNCEDEGSGLHVHVEHSTVQKSGRFIAVESVFQNTDCSGAPFAVRGVAIDRATGVPEVRFRLGSDEVRVAELEYDETGTWLLISLVDGTLEWQGGSGRVVLEPRDVGGALVEVAEASWGTEPATREIPGRAFIPTAFTVTDPGVPFPAERLDLEHGGEAWAVVLMAGPGGSAAASTAVSAAEAAGYETGWTDCDRGAHEAFGWTGGSTDGAVIGSVSIYMTGEQDARLAAQKFESMGTPAVATIVETFCLD